MEFASYSADDGDWVEGDIQMQLIIMESIAYSDLSKVMEERTERKLSAF